MTDTATVTVAHILSDAISEERKTLCGAFLKGVSTEGLPICRKCFNEQNKTLTFEYGVIVESDKDINSSMLDLASASTDFESVQRQAKRVSGQIVFRRVYSWVTVIE